MTARHDTLLFDLDGTLTDTDALHFEAYHRLLAPHGIASAHADYKLRIMGATNAAIMGWLFPGKPAQAHAALADAIAAIRDFADPLLLATLAARFGSSPR